MSTTEPAATQGETWAVVALKSPATAKSRLRPLLTQAERRDLYFIMARKVINALKRTPGIDKVLVVTTGMEVDRFVTRLGAEVIRQTEDKGTAEAFAHAIDNLKDFGRPARLLMIAGDLPLVSPEALSPLLNPPVKLAGAIIVPDRKRIGTNALLCSPPDAIPPCFGKNSFQKHCAAAKERGVSMQVLESEALSLDIDMADDLALLGAHFLSMPDPVDAVLRNLLARLRLTALEEEAREPHQNIHAD